MGISLGYQQVKQLKQNFKSIEEDEESERE